MLLQPMRTKSDKDSAEADLIYKLKQLAQNRGPGRVGLARRICCEDTHADAVLPESLCHTN